MLHTERRSKRSRTGPAAQGLGEAPQALFERDAAAEALASFLARERNVPLRLLLHQSRCRSDVAAVRQLAMYLMHVALGRSLSDVGRFFGRHPSTVSHACALIEDQRDSAVFDGEVARLEAALEPLTEAADGAR